MQHLIKEEGKFKFVEEGQGEPLILLHGLFGALSNFEQLIEHFKNTHRVVVPILPLFDLDILHTSVGGLAKYVHKFIETKGFQNVHLLGNSLGGHVALVHARRSGVQVYSLCDLWSQRFQLRPVCLS